MGHITRVRSSTPDPPLACRPHRKAHVVTGVHSQAHQAKQRSEIGRIARAAVVIQRAWRKHRTHRHFYGSFSPRRQALMHK